MSGETVTTIVGNLVADVDLRFTNSGTAVANLTIASTPRHFDKDTNGWTDGDPLFMRCSIWRQAAENVAESLTKGTRVVAVGRLRQRKYEKDGVERTVVEMELDEIGASMTFATVKVTRAARSDGNGQQRPAARSNARPAAQAPADDPWATAPPVSPGYRDNSEPPF